MEIKSTYLRITIELVSGGLVREPEARIRSSEPDRPARPGAAIPTYLTRREAASLMGISERQVDHLRAAGKLPWLKNGRRVLFKAEDIRSYLDRGYVSIGGGR